MKVEYSLKELEKIANEMESAETELDKAFELFEKGVFLYQEIKQKMNGYEKKIKILNDKFSTDEEKPDEEKFSDFNA